MDTMTRIAVLASDCMKSLWPEAEGLPEAEELRAAGVEVYSDPSDGRNGSELQTVSAKVRAPLEDENCRVILDCGGDGSGAMILRQFAKYFRSGDHRLLCIVNPNRPGTNTPEKAAAHIRAIESASGNRAASSSSGPTRACRSTSRSSSSSPSRA